METAQNSGPRRRRRDFSDQGVDGATFQTEVETARLRNNPLRPSWMRRTFSNQSGDSPDHGAYGATFQNKEETARLSRTRRRRRNFPDRGGDRATKNQFRARFFRQSRRRRDQKFFLATKIMFLTTEVDTVQLSRPRRRRRDFSEQGQEGAPSRPSRRRRDQEFIPRDQGGDGATFQTKAETKRLSRPRWRWRN